MPVSESKPPSQSVHEGHVPSQLELHVPPPHVPSQLAQLSQLP